MLAKMHSIQALEISAQMCTNAPLLGSLFALKEGLAVGHPHPWECCPSPIAADTNDYKISGLAQHKCVLEPCSLAKVKGLARLVPPGAL